MKCGITCSLIRSIEFRTLGPIGDPTTNWVIPDFSSREIFSLHTSGVPAIENASIILGVTEPNAAPKLPFFKPVRILFALSISTPCRSSITSGLPATMKATTGDAACVALSESLRAKVSTYYFLLVPLIIFELAGT